ncbi:MAG: restriction endonuclease subunit S, partial [Bacteroidota bacterium]
AINTKHLAAITLNKDIANPEFIAFALRSDPYIMRQIKKQGKGAVMTGLNLTIIKGLKLLLPPISLQNQFASRIQAIEAQKAQAQASLAQAEDLFNSLLQRAFKGELVG